MKSPEISSISAGYENLVHNNVQPLKSLSGSVLSSTRDLLCHSNEMNLILLISGLFISYLVITFSFKESS
jgi:hypothetical protein